MCAGKADNFTVSHRERLDLISKLTGDEDGNLYPDGN
jgi:hypothetical protein